MKNQNTFYLSLNLGPVSLKGGGAREYTNCISAEG